MISGDDDKIRAALTADSWHRKRLRWPLVNAFDVAPRKYKWQTTCVVTSSAMSGAMSNKRAPEQYRNELDFVNGLLALGAGHLWLCGGAAIGILFGEEFGDMDFFFVGLDAQGAEKLMHACITFLSDRFPHHSIYRSDLVVTFRVGKKSYQFIKRLYPTIDLVLGGFDIPFAAVGTDGANLWTTPMGAFCIEHWTMIVDTTRRSPSYEMRLIKYRQRYGLAAIFPGLRIADFAQLIEDSLSAWQIELPRLVINLYKDEIGSFHIKKHPSSINKLEEIDYAFDMYDERKIATANSRYLLLGQIERVVTVDHIEVILGSDDCDAVGLYKLAMSRRSQSHRKIYGDELFSYVRSKGEAWRHAIDSRMMGIVRKTIEARIAEIKDHRTRPIWITKNPGAQWTSSTQPIFEMPSEWYGKYWRPFRIGIEHQIFKVIYAGWRERGCVLNLLPRDLFRFLCDAILDSMVC